MHSVLITGANRGIGLEFARQYAALKPAPKHVFALCRNPTQATELAKIAQEATKNDCTVHVIEFDVVAYDKMDALVEQVDKIVGANGLNVLVNNAGVADVPDRLSDISPEAFRRNFEVNATSRAMLTKKFWPQLKRAASLQKDGTFRGDKAAVFNISSLYGSVDDCQSGGCIAYRSSKSALNMITRCSSIDMRADEILVVALSPGSVKTDMSNNEGVLETWESVSMMLDTIKKLDDSHNGKLVNYRGELLPY